MEYEDLSKEEFDAIVTGELTHHTLWHEKELNSIIKNYFISDNNKSIDFKRLILDRDGLTCQDKIEIVRAMCSLFKAKDVISKIKATLKKVEEFKSWRNTMAHGVDITDDETESLYIKIEVISRSGKPKVIEITPESHRLKFMEGEDILMELQKLRKELGL